MGDPWNTHWDDPYADDPDGLYMFGGLLQCRYCKAGELHWENIGSKRHPIWRLHDQHNRQHSCLKPKLEGNDG
jgi:hypothetical protein